jgi:DNA mismatch repair protein MutS
VQVARLAGMPAALLRQARATLEALEAKAQAGNAQVDLFAPAPTPVAETASSEQAALLEAFNALDPDTLTPREALDALYRLKLLTHPPKENPP